MPWQSIIPPLYSRATGLARAACSTNLYCRASLNTTRGLATSSARKQDAVVQLEHDIYTPPNGNKTEGALLILHGLFGSKRNFGSLCKHFMKDLNIPVYALDLRNQGNSPHAKPMTYSAMAADVLHFIHSRSLQHVCLLGHSMGGKVAMSVALDPSLSDSDVQISKLIVADVAPSRANLSPSFMGYIQTMKKIETAKVGSRREALEMLEECEPDITVRQFLLTNLNRITTSEPFAKFRVPLETLAEAMPEIGSFPYMPGERVWEGLTLFIKGSQSAYINHNNLPSAKSFFPNLRLETLDAGHWVHGERPNEFRKLVVDFISNTPTNV